jgi:tRNA pseudouridine38-40 synthase
LRYFIEIAYNGKNYHGWQVQPNAKSIQGVLEHTLSTIFRKDITVTGAGRTDTGVHAKQLFAHFDHDKIEDNAEMVFQLNSFLPKDISVKEIIPVKNDAHARFDAIQREYEYVISLQKDPFQLDFSYLIHHEPNIEKMNEAANILLEYKDFQCFSRNKTNVKTYHCDIKQARWKRKDHRLIFTISADRFLRNMVRAIVGTLLEIGFEKISLADFHDIIKSKDRSKAGTSAPAHGLYLMKILYPENIKNIK